MSVVKRSVMTLYSESDSCSHQVRIVLAEKGVSVDIRLIDSEHPCEELAEINPYNTLPTLLDRELVLYQAPIIMEYLDERFPHPPLLPVYPVARAKSRLMMHRIDRDWYALLRQAEAAQGGPEGDEALAQLKQSLAVVAPVFASMPWFFSEEYSMVDAYLAPLLWRFYALGGSMPKQAKAVDAYAKRLFARESFQASLTEVEREMGDL